MVSAEGRDLLFSISDKEPCDILIKLASSNDLSGRVFLHCRRRVPRFFAAPPFFCLALFGFLINGSKVVRFPKKGAFLVLLNQSILSRCPPRLDHRNARSIKWCRLLTFKKSPYFSFFRCLCQLKNPPNLWKKKGFSPQEVRYPLIKVILKLVIRYYELQKTYLLEYLF